MSRPVEPALCQLIPGHDPEREVLALSQQTLGVIRIASALIGSARPVDLNGLEGQVGLLCAKALDLAPGQTGFAKLELRRLVEELDALENNMRNDSA